MKSFVCVTLAAVAFAAKSDFPKDDMFHADCHVTAQFDSMSCADLYQGIDKEIRAWNSDTTSPSQGVYTLKEENDTEYIWSTRLTKNKKYTDDQIFMFEDSNGGCKVSGHSRSQSVSYYDYSVNFCNLWNVYNNLGSAFTYDTGSCASEPKSKDVASTCATY